MLNIQVRQGVFETNSSSTHSISIPCQTSLTIPELIHFEIGDFGSDTSILSSIAAKASYLYTGFAANDRMKDAYDIILYLLSEGIAVTAEDVVYDEYESLNDGYMDHANELNGFLDAIVANKDMMMRYLFSPYSFILTGSDNDYSYVIDNKEVMEYASDFFYKGN